MVDTTGRRIAMVAGTMALLHTGLLRAEQGARERIDEAGDGARSALRGWPATAVILDEASDWPDGEWPKDATVRTTGPVTAGVDLDYSDLEARVLAFGREELIDAYTLDRVREAEKRFVLRDEPICLPEAPGDVDRPRRGTPARQPVAPRSSYTPHQGARERERRLRKTLQPKEL